MQSPGFGFRIVGALYGERRLVDWPTAFNAYAACDPKAKIESEAYLSAFMFGETFRDHHLATGSTKDYFGECFGRWLWFDIDREDVSDALSDARKLVSTITYRYGCEELLTFFSGSKGFHVGIPSSLWNGEPSTRFNRYGKTLAVAIATEAKVKVDASVYDKVRAFRAPNSRHQKTGLHKRYLTTDELLNLRIEKIVELSRLPEPFEIPDNPSESAIAIQDWKAAAVSVDAIAAASQTRRQSGEPRTSLNRSTMEFIHDGADVGNRHPALFKAAANLSEFGCSFELAYALLSEVALDSGLSPSEVRRQIECGLKHQGGES